MAEGILVTGLILWLRYKTKNNLYEIELSETLMGKSGLRLEVFIPEK
jgi:hypothetical protein